jgi:hypothetical protein
MYKVRISQLSSEQNVYIVFCCHRSIPQHIVYIQLEDSDLERSFSTTAASFYDSMTESEVTMVRESLRVRHRWRHPTSSENLCSETFEWTYADDI